MKIKKLALLLTFLLVCGVAIGSAFVGLLRILQTVGPLNIPLWQAVVMVAIGMVVLWLIPRLAKKLLR